MSPMRRTDDVNVAAAKPLITPRALKERVPITPAASEAVFAGREVIKRILDKEDKRFLAIVGPCSIHDAGATLEYAERLAELHRVLGDRLFIVMRTYFEKPRTATGWKGFINDPNLDGTCDMHAGLQRARELLVAIAEMGLPTATEMLDPIVPQYLADLVVWAAIGARTTESQTHREMASGLSMPVGFKNSTDGNLRAAINATLAARGSHHFLGIDQDGRTCVVQTRGNPAGHIILRGGGGRPNYDPVSVAETEEQLSKAGLAPRIVVDCSHANCGKRCELQAHVFKDVLQQRLNGTTSLIGVMLESNLRQGAQGIAAETGELTYGVSVTDPCLSWETTEVLLRYAHKQLAPGA